MGTNKPARRFPICLTNCWGSVLPKAEGLFFLKVYPVKTLHKNPEVPRSTCPTQPQHTQVDSCLSLQLDLPEFLCDFKAALHKRDVPRPPLRLCHPPWVSLPHKSNNWRRKSSKVLATLWALFETLKTDRLTWLLVLTAKQLAAFAMSLPCYYTRYLCILYANELLQ